MDFVRKHKTELTIGAAIAAVAAGAFFIFKSKKDDDESSQSKTQHSPTVVRDLTQKQQHQFENAVDETVEKFAHLTKSKIIASIKPEKDNGRFTMKTIYQVYDAIIEFSKDDFVKLILDDRKARRSASNDQEYVNVWEKFNEKLEAILSQAQSQVLSELGLNDKEFEETVEKYMEEGSQELFMIHTMLPQRMKMTVPHSKVVDKEAFKKIMQSQVDYLNNNATSFKGLLQYASSPDQVAAIIQNKVNDYVNEEFFVEEEDLVATMKDKSAAIMNDREIQTLMGQVQQSTMKAMQSIMGGMPGMGGGMPGMDGMDMGGMDMGAMNGNPMAGLF